MNLNRIGANWNRESRNDWNENMDILENSIGGATSSISEAITKANQAITKSTEAESKSTEAANKVTQVQEQLNNIIIDSGTSDAEVIQARGGYDVLNTRLDQKEAELIEQVEQVSVGAVNLLDDSNLDVKPGWLSGVNADLTFSNSVGRLQINTPGATAVRFQITLAANFIPQNENYTLSLKYRSDTPLEVRSLVNATLVKVSDFTISSEWRISYFTFNVNSASDATTLRIYTTNLSVGTYVEVDYFKLERGNRYTDYTLSLNDQYKQFNNRIITSSGVVRYGALKYPPEFNKKLPFEVYRDRDGKVKHTLLKSKFENVSKVYLSRQFGVDTNNGNSEQTAVRSLTKAFELANASPESSVDIIFCDKTISYTLSSPSVNQQEFTLTKNIRLASLHEEGTILGTFNDTYIFSWVNVTGSIYRTNRSAVNYVYDYKEKDFLGLPKALTKVASQAEMFPGSYFIDGANVYVWRFDNSIPDSDIMLFLPIDASITFNINGYQLVVDNLHFWLSQNTLAANALYIKGNQLSKFYMFNSSTNLSRFNGTAFSDVGESYTFNCSAYKNGYDGFNYHGSGDEFAFEYNFYGYENGAIIGGTGNATTAHDGITILRIGSVGHDCYGPLLADVNGCLSINYDCVMYDSLRSAGPTKAAYYTDNSNVTDGRIGKMYLYNCQGGGTNTFTANSDGIAQIYASGLSGGNIPQNLVINNI